MLEAFDVCDKIEKLFFRTSKDHESCEVKFTFCEELFEFQSRNDGDGWGPIEPDENNVYPVSIDYEAMFWIACTLAKRIQNG